MIKRGAADSLVIIGLESLEKLEKVVELEMVWGRVRSLMKLKKRQGNKDYAKCFTTVVW